ncbi:alpha-(1,3)-fucosyltransferase 4-like [Coregonus clupeaformis]|uniref:alpha-(1,3)-fucosyltransferase 4-like n=1 Tax=Coregonus clupeaformis TaxID=59861 RepID=UPI001E1C62EC|nr:alpha-(1,3)-fucosyltransferase 4-like [Coregonus clupeaformis]
MEVTQWATQWITGGRSTSHRAGKRPRLRRVTVLRTSWLCFAALVCMLFLFLGVCFLNLFDPRLQPLPLTGVEPRDVTLLLWTHPFGHYRRLPDCEARFGICGCVLTDDQRMYPWADAVIMHHREIATNATALPPDPRPSGQKWIWMNFESPSHTRGLRRFEGMFNLTMTYRADSDIFLPYGYLVPRLHPHANGPHTRPRRPHLLAWVISNWSESQARVVYYRRLANYVGVDVFGRAGVPLPEDSTVVRTVRRYQFYLALENSQHTDYITEKLWNSLLAGAIPVVLGPPRENYERFLPHDAFIHVDDFPSPRLLAQYLLRLRRSPALLQRHLAWRKNYCVHLTAFWAEHYCTACRAVQSHRLRTNTITNLQRWFES